jgi:lipid II:glycine glycyltransferase (peptidoglycan interpeptide bridge formation enzyme)
LFQDDAALWQGVCRGHRSSINKARRNGVTIEARKIDDESLSEFETLYNETMERNQADPLWWHFPSSYFKNYVNCLGEEKILLFNAQYKGEIIASYLILHEFQTAYYHFGGSRELDFNLRANNLLIYEIALWAKKRGYRWFHLGGGIQPDDGVFRFKSGFSKSQALLFSCGRIHDQNRYTQLCSIKESWDLSRNIPPQQSSFFPAYRR